MAAAEADAEDAADDEATPDSGTETAEGMTVIVRADERPRQATRPGHQRGGCLMAGTRYQI